MIEVNKFEALKIGIASPEKFVVGLMVKLRNRRQSTIEH